MRYVLFSTYGWKFTNIRRIGTADLEGVAKKSVNSENFRCEVLSEQAKWRILQYTDIMRFVTHYVHAIKSLPESKYQREILTYLTVLMKFLTPYDAS